MSEKNNETLKWPYELFGVECGKGWYKLLDPIFEYVEKYNNEVAKGEEEKITFLQIKEKFGGLRVYTNFVTDELRELIDKAEDESYKTCEICGSVEDVGTAYEGWLVTECHSCMKEWVIKNERPHRWRRNSDGNIYWIYPDKDDELFNKD